ncbi:MAG: hypothetical protein A2X05_18835 [Bacteroidetes bacterium GWE2_41_25]|nr:MAG: hypothetical protein A2X03_12045 [Bacteroidetes bacterium GWA2_40_15]OFX93640.1 MAG: hypothetical protein A2X06_05540 [Bacteroidetes bacterium GWC2_40_22]OFY01632.1 MAG: hypothetical protein A2X05_18835 [Bacteroidetes bacterium GWE2_41_25]OFY60397.1 MAG: hypothetical protein A2X04_17505 [Bacteroidetes bacterium GWF2_41_9]HCU19939.1 hypothetical protein [Bacteroidales bacterium]
MKLAWKMYHANNTFGSYHRYVKRVAGDTIRQSLMLNDESIPERIYKKIQWYMVEAVFIGEMLARMADNSISKRDKESLIYLGAIMALFDVIVDDIRLKRDIVNEILEHTFSTTGSKPPAGDSAIVRVYFLYVDKLIATIDKEQWREISGHLNIIRLQMKSDEQLMNSITEESVNSITLGKGGVATLICSVFLQQKSESFREAVFELGGFIQMMNDCQDLHKDTVAGIKTFVHFSKDFSEIFNKLDEKRMKTFHLIQSLDYSYKGRKETLFDLNAMFIVISYKLQRYAENSNYSLDFKFIADMNKEDFRINPFSPAAVSACLGKILRFNFENCELTPDFKFEQADRSKR